MTENKMCFPETWEEFRKQYRIVDTEKVYTNGTEMIPTFRVKQWLDHMESVKRSQQSEQNKMAQVAALFGKKLGEAFDIKWGECEYTIRFTIDGMEVTDDCGEWYDAQLYRVLFTGEAEIVEE